MKCGTKAWKKGGRTDTPQLNEVSIISVLPSMIINALGLNLPVRASGLAQPGTPLNWQADISRLSALDYAPRIPLEEGIRSFTAWCREEIE